MHLIEWSNLPEEYRPDEFQDKGHEDHFLRILDGDFKESWQGRILFRSKRSKYKAYKSWNKTHTSTAPCAELRKHFNDANILIIVQYDVTLQDYVIGLSMNAKARFTFREFPEMELAAKEAQHVLEYLRKISKK